MNQVPGLISAFSSNGRASLVPDFKLFLNLLKERFELFEVFALLTIGNFLGRAFLFAGANMPKFCDVRRACCTLQFGP